VCLPNLIVRGAAAPVWTAAARPHLDQLQTVQNKFLRIILNVPYDTYIEDLHKEAKIESTDEFMSQMFRESIIPQILISDSCSTTALRTVSTFRMFLALSFFLLFLLFLQMAVSFFFGKTLPVSYNCTVGKPRFLH